MNNIEQDKLDIDDLTQRFFDLFTNANGMTTHVEGMKSQEYSMVNL